MQSSFRPQQLLNQRFSVEFEYPVVFCDDALSPTDSHLLWAITRREPERRHPVMFVADAGLAAAWPDLAQQVQNYAAAHARHIELRAELMLVPAGEPCKNDPAVLEGLLHAFADARLDRQASVIAIGGGAALDVIGYAAAIVHRGLRLVRMPSTVLAQNDAGVGVKNGVNARSAKNFLGTFAPPFAVVNDSRWLSSLPTRDARAGFAEAIKVSLIRDAAFFEWIERHADELVQPLALGERNLALEELIRRCAELHLRHIAAAGDPFENGSARPLDYGHWAAHRLEIMTHHELRHGEAVMIGMLLDARYAERAGLLATSALERLLKLAARLGLPLFHPALLTRSQHAAASSAVPPGQKLEILSGLEHFREHLGGTLCLTLLTGIGQSVEVSTMDEDRIEEAVAWLEVQARAFAS
jgi:3-dehydroquinate synthase